MKTYLIRLVLISLSLVNAHVKIEKCMTKKGVSGFCRERQFCVGYHETLTSSGCIHAGSVCCPRRKISEQKCEEYKKKVEFYTKEGDCNPEVAKGAQKLIIGGLPALEGEFNHMVVLGVVERAKITWVCGGTLISELYVLTAAHCLRKDLRKVKLGATKLKEDGNFVKTRDIAKMIPYPRYLPRSYTNDIGLIKMNREVKLNPHLNPICLDFTGKAVEDKQIATGWGDTKDYGKPSNDLLKVQLSLADIHECKKLYRNKFGTRFPESVLCVGKEKGKDTCVGDSGGPIHDVLPITGSCLYMQTGVLSFGIICGDGTPAIYTRVWSYLPWIESIVWPGES